MNIIVFKKNYNGKLDSQHYIALLPKKAEYIVGSHHAVYVNKKHHHDAEIKLVELKSLNQLESWFTLLDVGISASHYKHAVIKHNAKIDPDDLFYQLILFQRLPSKTNEKIALFCGLYERHYNIKYKITPGEIGMLKRVEITQDLVERFFKSTEFWAKVKSVVYYCKNINEIKRIAINQHPDGHPNIWDVNYIKKLEPMQFMNYCKHLKSLGLVGKKNAAGSYINFVKP